MSWSAEFWTKIDQQITSDSSAITSTLYDSGSPSTVTIVPDSSGTGQSFNLYGQTHSGLQGKNKLIQVQTSSGCAGQAQVQLRFKDTSNIGMVAYLDKNSQNAVLLQQNAGTASVLASGQTIPGFSASSDYRLTVKTYNNMCHLLVQDATSLDIVSDTSVSGNAVFKSSVSKVNGLGASSASQAYTIQTGKTLTNFVNFICIGDSNTAGTLSSGNYVQQLNKTFIDSPITFINQGVSGDTSYEIINRLDTSVKFKIVDGTTNVATLLVGTNDVAGNYGHTYNETTTINNINQIVSYLKAKGVIVWVLTYPPRTDNSSFNATLTKLNKRILSSVSADLVIDAATLFIDSTQLTPTISGNFLPSSGNLQSDGLHFSVQGATVIANAISSAGPTSVNAVQGPLTFQSRIALAPFAVTQSTTTSSVNSSSYCTLVTSPSQTLAAKSSLTWSMINPLVTTDSIVTVSIVKYTGTGYPFAYVSNTIAGQCNITLLNTSTTSTFSAPITFLVNFF